MIYNKLNLLHDSFIEYVLCCLLLFFMMITYFSRRRWDCRTRNISHRW